MENVSNNNHRKMIKIKESVTKILFNWRTKYKYITLILVTTTLISFGVELNAGPIGKETAKELTVMTDSPSGYLGIVYNKENGNVIVRRVIPNSPAESVGIKENDIITEINGIAITMVDDLTNGLKQTKPGDVIQIKILSGIEEKTMKVQLGEAPFEFHIGSSLFITVNGLSDEYKRIFFEKRSVIEHELNRCSFYSKLAPIYITVNYEDETGYILMDANYVTEAIPYESLRWGTKTIYALDLTYVHDLLGTLGMYKFAVACSAAGVTVNRALPEMSVLSKIFAFDLYIRMQKSNGDWFEACAINRSAFEAPHTL